MILVNNVIFLENIEGYFFRVFHGLLLFGRLPLFVYDKIPRLCLLGGTVGLNMYETLKKMLEQAKHIFDTFEYF